MTCQLTLREISLTQACLEHGDLASAKQRMTENDPMERDGGSQSAQKREVGQEKQCNARWEIDTPVCMECKPCMVVFPPGMWLGLIARMLEL